MVIDSKSAYIAVGDSATRSPISLFISVCSDDMDTDEPVESRSENDGIHDKDDGEFLFRIREQINSLDIEKLVDGLDEADYARLVAIKRFQWPDLFDSGGNLTDRELLKLFCVVDLPAAALVPLDSSWILVLDMLRLDGFRRRVGATNEDSASVKYTMGLYACEWWRYNAMVMVTLTFSLTIRFVK